jgi:hypothetical protein
MLPRVVRLRQIGALVHLFDQEGGFVAACHMPRPVTIGDLAATGLALFRIVDLVDCPPGNRVDVLAMVERVRLTAVSR